jgi:hypothetical protein
VWTGRQFGECQRADGYLVGKVGGIDSAALDDDVGIE